MAEINTEAFVLVSVCLPVDRFCQRHVRARCSHKTLQVWS